jgi:hypothetical protein
MSQFEHNRQRLGLSLRVYCRHLELPYISIKKARKRLTAKPTLV